MGRRPWSTPKLSEYGHIGKLTQGASGKNNETLSFFIYGIADLAITPAGSNFNIYNTGCTVNQANTYMTGTGSSTVTTACDGKIHIDFYRDALVGGTNPSFNNITSSGAQINDRTGFSSFTGLTDGTLEMGWTLDASTVKDGDVFQALTTLFQNVSSATAPASGSGSFYASCTSGPLCATFDNNSFTTETEATADFFGGYDAKGTDQPQFALAAQNGWLVNIADPVNTFAIPEPTTLSILGLGLIGVSMAARRRSRRQA